MRARRVAFPKGRAWSFIAGKGFSLGSSRVSPSIGSFLPLIKLYRTAVATIIVRVVESFVLMDMERQGNNLFQTQNILSTVFLVRICDTLYLRSGGVCGSTRGVIKYGRHRRTGTFLGGSWAEFARMTP